MARLVLLGRIGAAHGLRGEVVVQSFAANPLDLKAYGALTDKDGKRTFEIATLRQAGKGLIGRIKGVNDRTAAEALRGAELHVERAKLPPAKDGDYYLADLIGLSAHAPDGALIGEVVDVPNYGGGDLIEIKPEAGGETLLLPFTRACVPAVDIAGGRILVVIAAMAQATPDGAEEE
jgi:16S rRNA processing protein RimM